MIDLTPRAGQALAADSPVRGFFGKLPGLAAEAHQLTSRNPSLATTQLAQSVSFDTN